MGSRVGFVEFYKENYSTLNGEKLPRTNIYPYRAATTTGEYRVKNVWVSKTPINDRHASIVCTNGKTVGAFLGCDGGWMVDESEKVHPEVYLMLAEYCY